jgi:hypothetical protein
MEKEKRKKVQLRFPSVRMTDLPAGHKKHGKIVFEILGHLRKLDEYTSIKIDLGLTGKKKAELRAALHRAAKKESLELSTTSDNKNLYVFHRRPKSRLKL